MADLINRQDAIDGKIPIQLSNGVEIYNDEAVPVDYLKHLPTADVVEVVRCKDCKHYDDGLCRRWKYSHVTSEDSFCSGAEWESLQETDYCSYAERRGNED